jgi:hypothetical protein
MESIKKIQTNAEPSRFFEGDYILNNHGNPQSILQFVIVNKETISAVHISLAFTIIEACYSLQNTTGMDGTTATTTI